MPFESIDMDEINEARRKAIAASIRTISVEELTKLGEKIFPIMDHPWRDKFFGFISENAGETFHHATTDEGGEFIYCRGKEKGMWFVPGTGMGPLQPQGLAMFKKIVEAQ